MRIALFGGSFDPVHKEHVALVKAAIESLALDKVIIIPSFVAPHKLSGAFASGEDRLNMCKLAFEEIPEAEVSDYELRAEQTSYTYLTCRAFAQKYSAATRFFLMGKDMLGNSFLWRNPEDILRSVTLAVCGREEAIPPMLHEQFVARFHRDYASVEYIGERVSSTVLRVQLAFGKKPQELDEKVYRYIREHNLYTHPAIAPALALEKEERREHSYRAAKMAVLRAKSLRIPEQDALLAAALHDCGKYVPLNSPLLKGFSLDHEVPAPVLHQYTGAYLAEHVFGIEDEDILNAIRYHTSGRAGMSALEKLIYLSDMLEEGRAYEALKEFRVPFWLDFDECFKECVKFQMEYLKSTGKPVYRLTEEAYQWINQEL